MVSNMNERTYHKFYRKRTYHNMLNLPVSPWALVEHALFSSLFVPVQPSLARNLQKYNPQKEVDQQPSGHLMGQPSGHHTVSPRQHHSEPPSGQLPGSLPRHPMGPPFGQPRGHLLRQPSAGPFKQPEGPPSGQSSESSSQQPNGPSAPEATFTRHPSVGPLGHPSTGPFGHPSVGPLGHPSGPVIRQHPGTFYQHPSEPPLGRHPTEPPSVQPEGPLQRHPTEPFSRSPIESSSGSQIEPSCIPSVPNTTCVPSFRRPQPRDTSNHNSQKTPVPDLWKGAGTCGGTEPDPRAAHSEEGQLWPQPNEFGVRLVRPHRLLPHQQRMILFMKSCEQNSKPHSAFPSLELQGGLLGAEMGTGKTLSVLTLIASTLPEQRASRTITLYVCKAALIDTLENEIQKFFGVSLRYIVLLSSRLRQHTLTQAELLRYDLAVTSYDTLAMQTPEKHSHLHDDMPWFRVVYDESHHMANKENLRHRSAFRLRTSRVICLTGTPMRNAMQDVVNQLTLCGLSHPDFSGKALKNDAYVSDMLQHWHIMPDRFMLVRFADMEHVTLPPKLCQDVLVKPTTLELELNQLLIRDLRYDRLKASTFARNRALELVRMLMLTAFGPCLLPEHERQTLPPHMHSLLDRQGVGGWKNSKMLAFRAILHRELTRGKIIVFANWKNCLRLAQEVAEQDQPGCSVMATGDLNAKALRLAFQRHRSDPWCRVLFITRDLGAEGLNLNYACTVIWLQPWYCFGSMAQGEARVHRLGQKQKVHIYYVVGEDTPEQRCLEIARKKQMLSESLAHQTCSTKDLMSILLGTTVEPMEVETSNAPLTIPVARPKHTADRQPMQSVF